MTHVSIIGTGNMGQAIATVATKGGHPVELLGKDDPATGDVVVLAVPHSAMHALLQQRANGSATDEIAAALPHSHVLEAFNTTFAATLAAGTVGPLTTTVLIAGDSSDAKVLLADVITTGGLRAIDAGSLCRARELEALGLLQLTLAARELVPWTAASGSRPDQTRSDGASSRREHHRPGSASDRPRVENSCDLPQPRRSAVGR